MFASMGMKSTGVSVKTNSIETAQMLINITQSYEIIRRKLTKKAQAALPEYSL